MRSWERLAVRDSGSRAAAGQTAVTISVGDLDQFVTDLASRGISAGPVEAVGDAGRKANVVDADGNVISWIEVATSRQSRRSTAG